MSDNIQALANSQAVPTAKEIVESFDFDPEYSPASPEVGTYIRELKDSTNPVIPISNNIARKDNALLMSFDELATGVDINLRAIESRDFSADPVTVGFGSVTVQAPQDFFNGLDAAIGTGSRHNDVLGENFRASGVPGHNFYVWFDGGAGDDTLYGGNNADHLIGGVGNDRLYGLLGNDYLVPGSGIDIVDGGDGFDAMLLDYRTATSGVTIRSQEEQVPTIVDRQTEENITDIGITSEGDVFLNVEEVYVVGSQYGDVIDATGSDPALNIDLDNHHRQPSRITYYAEMGAGDDVVKTTIGHDVIDAGAGNDLVDAGTGQDTIYGGEGDDMIRTQDGGDRLHGGAGSDVLSTVIGIQGLTTHLVGGAGADVFALDLQGDATTTYDFNFNLQKFAEFAGSIINAIRPEREGPDAARVATDVAFAVGSGALGAVPVVGPLLGIGVDIVQIGVDLHLDAGERNAEIDRLNRNSSSLSRSLLQSDGNFGELKVTVNNRDRAIIEDFEIGVDRIILPSLDKLNQSSRNFTYEYVIEDGVTQNGQSAFVKLNGRAKSGINQANTSVDILEIKADRYYTGLTLPDRPNFLETLRLLHHDGIIGTASNIPQLADGTTTIGTNAHDRLFGGNGNEKLSGWLGDDVIKGGGGNDVLYGGFGDLAPRMQQLGLWTPADGNDVLLGEGGDDILYGEGGDDYLEGGSGNDRVIGGTGADMFVLDVRNGTDFIADFNAQEGDRIVFKAFFDLNQLAYNRTTGSLSYGDRTFAILENRPADFVPQAHIRIPNAGAFTLTLENQYRQLTGQPQRAYTPVEIGGLSVPHLFDEAHYLNTNQDVAAAVRGGGFASGYDHFVTYGWGEGRNPSALYNEAHYLANNADVAAAIGPGGFQSGLQHFMLYGHAENRTASTLFDAQDYLANNPDVANAVNAKVLTSAFEHYLEFGLAEGRASGLIFDESFYVKTHNAQMAQANLPGLAAGTGLEHFISLGQKSGQPNDLFDESSYLAANPDVASAVNAGALPSGFTHYLNHGRFEAGRLIG